MKKIVCALACCLTFFTAFSQDFHCATDRVMDTYYHKHPELKQKKQQEDIARMQRVQGQQQVASASFTIPVVFHILHLGGPENISDAQVRDGLRILNRDYAKQNPDTVQIIPSFQSLADSTGIQFALATIDPNGNCTNGILHHYDSRTDWYDTSLYTYTWDPTKYMNVYIVRTITMGNGFGAAGYTYFPGSFADGDPMDAIVVLNNYFGSVGTSSGFTSRVLTHEVGHWLSLYHVFGATNGAGVDCSGDDFISDTPVTAGYLYCPDSNDPSTYQLCTPGVDENFQNYMDYSYCVRMFTQEQGIVMRNTLQATPGARNNLSTHSNLLATGVLNPMNTCTPVADFMYDRKRVCVGTPVTFSDASQNGTPTSYTWTLTGATPSSSTNAAPSVVYNTPGVYSVSYVCGNTAGTSAPVTKTNIITVIPATAMYQNFYQEGFETDVFGSGEWDEYSSSGGSHWVMTSNASFTGTGSAVIPYAGNTRNMKTVMESPSFDLGTVSNPILTYYYASQETDPNHVNALEVFITTDCGTTWMRIDSIGGMDLATAGLGPQGYIPADQSEWMEQNLSLSSFASSQYVYFKFQYTRDTVPAANNFYIDDINITPAIGIAEHAMNAASFQVFPNPSGGEIQVKLNRKADAIYVTDVLGNVLEKNYITDGTLQLQMLQHKPDAGVYFVHVVSGTQQAVKKVIVN